MMKNHLRLSDVQEVWASHHHTPEKALELSFAVSELCLTVDVKGMPAVIFGITPQTLLDNSATVWMLATEKIRHIRKSFVKECQHYIDMMLIRYPVLENYVDARNVESIRWLKWCGAVIEEAKPYGVEQLPFHYFYFGRTN
jgi:hypothetical protein